MFCTSISFVGRQATHVALGWFRPSPFFNALIAPERVISVAADVLHLGPNGHGSVVALNRQKRNREKRKARPGQGQRGGPRHACHLIRCEATASRRSRN